MKVGLFVDGIQTTDGGGYTYVLELLAALHRLQDKGGHDFVICHCDAGDMARLFPGLSTLNLDALRPGVLSPKEKLFRPLPGIVARAFDRLFSVPSKSPCDERIYTREGIQFLIRLVPWHAMTMNLPFGAVLWDLQHRNNPWFPEVSSLAEWEGREANYSRLLRRASIIYTGTVQGQREITAYYQVPAERIEVLPFPTPTFALDAADTPKNPEVLRKLGVPADYLFYPAQFWSHKNHVAVLEACRLIRGQTGWDLGVVFVGSEKGNRSYVESYARHLGLETCTRFLGFIEQADLVQLYKSAFCLAYATFCGPDNLPSLEAFALGCPVVASSVPGAEEQLETAALLYPPADEEALARAILSLREPALREHLIMAGRARAARHTWDEYAGGIIRSLNKFAKIRRAWL